jgi:hypothetical protein
MKLIAFVLAIAIASSSAQSDPRVALLKRGTVKVLAWKLGSSRPYPGSAIAIGSLDDKTFFLTACHLVASTQRIEIQTFDNREGVGVSVFDDRCDEQNDLAVLVASRYQVSKSIEQIVQTDSSKLRAGDRLLVLGHPLDREWYLRETKVRSVTSTRIFVEPDVISDGDSGGPMLDTTGGLVGVIRGSAANGSGEGIRLDAAQAVLDAWRVPYKTRLRVDFCEQITHIIGWSEKDFSEIKGAQINPVNYNWARQQPEPEWELRDKWMDITGEGRSRLTTDSLHTSGSATSYVAKFGKQANVEQARQVQSDLAAQVKACLPTKENIFKTENCLKVGWRRRWSHTPIFFFVYLDTNLEVELIMYRTYGNPYVCIK